MIEYKNILYCTAPAVPSPPSIRWTTAGVAANNRVISQAGCRWNAHAFEHKDRLRLRSQERRLRGGKLG
jgi:hypothetical protein